jgi:hypothetical protein
MVRARRCWERHLSCARWMTKTSYRRILERAVAEQTRLNRH